MGLSSLVDIPLELFVYRRIRILSSFPNVFFVKKTAIFLSQILEKFSSNLSFHFKARALAPLIYPTHFGHRLLPKKFSLRSTGLRQ